MRSLKRVVKQLVMGKLFNAVGCLSVGCEQVVSQDFYDYL